MILYDLLMKISMIEE